jgi:hypothetical protein
MFDAGLYPLPLWVAAHFDSGADALHTMGMTQFEAPEIYLAEQPDPAPSMVDFLFQVAQYVLASHHQIKDGEKMHGPHGTMKIKSTTSGDQGRRVLILEPTNRRTRVGTAPVQPQLLPLLSKYRGALVP